MQLSEMKETIVYMPQLVCLIFVSDILSIRYNVFEAKQTDSYVFSIIDNRWINNYESKCADFTDARNRLTPVYHSITL